VLLEIAWPRAAQTLSAPEGLKNQKEFQTKGRGGKN
jgi:hypothetical protein